MTIQQVIDKIICLPSRPRRKARRHLRYGEIWRHIQRMHRRSPTACHLPLPRRHPAAGEAGCNLLVVHEPSFYGHMDPLEWLKGQRNGRKEDGATRCVRIVLFRDHDRIHAHVPDGIFYGLFAELGWLSIPRPTAGRPHRPRTAAHPDADFAGHPGGENRRDV